MNSVHVPIGVLLSTDGAYSVPTRAMLDGVLLAVSEVNSQPENSFYFDIVHADPGGNTARYLPLCDELLSRGIQHIVGCYTSASRKEVLGSFEQSNALLWYPSHYEGFETASNIIYTGAAPNQHITPLIEYLLANLGERAICIGSNYVWAWENNRILRDALSANNGEIISEQYIPIGGRVDRKIIDDVIANEPDFIFNTLIGTSSYDFLRDFRHACRLIGIDQAERFPVVSCSLSEAELLVLGKEVSAGHLTSSPYFSSIDAEANHRFISAYKSRFGHTGGISADAEAAYTTIKLLSQAIEKCGSADPQMIMSSVGSLSVESPKGLTWLDSTNYHSFQIPRIGRSRADGQFDVLWTAPEHVRPDPYLLQSMPRREAIPFSVVRKVS